MSAQRGRFIVLEGGEGAGKSTQARRIQDWLETQGREVVLTREPGGTALAEAIRELLLCDWPSEMPPVTELLLMFAARRSHLVEVIQPALARGADVVCDRFIDASYAYQAAGRGIPVEQVQALEAMVLEGTRPDLVLLFDLDPAIGLQRARARGDSNRFDDESLAFQQRVRSAYLQRAGAEPQRYALIDASGDTQAVGKAVQRALETRL